MNAISSAMSTTDARVMPDRAAIRPLAGPAEGAQEAPPDAASTPATDGAPGVPAAAPTAGIRQPGSAPPSHSSRTTTPGALSAQDQAVVAELRRIDLQVRTHEMAHMSAGAGVVTGGPSYTYQSGPDGGRYAVAGEVPISLSPDPRDPAGTLRKAEQVQRAALAPAEPSSQDRAVAAAAATVAGEARAQLAQARAQALKEGSTGSSPGHDTTTPPEGAPQVPGSPSTSTGASAGERDRRGPVDVRV